jgi:pimeloyl-ACP methyl ester carboxylesterase
VKQLGERVRLSHDAIGFGFTDYPPDDIQCYTIGSLASIGTQLLLHNINVSPKPAVTLFEHSLGALTTLKMMLNSPKNLQSEKEGVISATAILVMMMVLDPYK